MSAEFTCCECGRSIVVITADFVPEPPLCAACMTMPGWFRYPQIRGALDPDHDGHEPALAGVPVWEPGR